MKAASSPFHDITQNITTSSEYKSFVILFWVLCLIVVALCALCYFLIEQYFHQQIRRQGDIEVGLPQRNPWQQDQAPSVHQGGELQLIIIAQEEDEQAFREVSWTAFKDQSKEEDITNGTSECVICMEEFKDGDECRVRSECNHLYHKSCIDEWRAIRKPCCPLCRGYVSVNYCQIVRSKQGN